MSPTLIFFLLPFLLAMSAFFSASEISMFSADRTLLRHLARTGNSAARRAIALITRPELLLGIALIGNNLVNSSIATLSDSLLAGIVPAGFESVANAIVATPVILLFGEFLPKVFARAHADRCALRIATPLRMVGWLIWPLATLTAWAGGAFTRFIARHRKVSEIDPFQAHEELDLLAEMATEQGVLPPHTGDLLRQFFRLEKCPIGDLLPAAANRPWLSLDATLEDVERLSCDAGHDLFPVWHPTPAHPVGTVSLHTLLFALGSNADCREPIRAHVNRDLLSIAASESFGAVLQRLQSSTAPAILIHAPDQSVRGVLTPHELFNALLLHAPDKEVA